MILNGTGHKQLSSFHCKHDDEYKYERIWAYMKYYSNHTIYSTNNDHLGETAWLVWCRNHVLVPSVFGWKLLYICNINT